MCKTKNKKIVVLTKKSEGGEEWKLFYLRLERGKQQNLILLLSPFVFLIISWQRKGWSSSK